MMTNTLSNYFSNKTLKDYEVISVLGSGSYGTCYKVRDRDTNKLYAWKAIDYDEFDDMKLESLASEISVLRQLQHPNIVHYYHHLNSHEAKSIFIIMEWCEGGDLSQLISQALKTGKRFDERYIWRVLFQLCKALQVCHSKLKQGTVLHRDIKPANIFLDVHGNAKLGDFGLARLLKRNQNFAVTFVGTPYYMSPEIIKGSRYGCRSDIWALGCLTYEMAALRPPFRGDKLQQLTNNISTGRYTEISHIYSKDLQEIIRFMLEVTEKERPCVEMVGRHPNVIRNVSKLDTKIEPLVDAEQHFFNNTEDTMPRIRLRYSSHSSSFLSSKDNSCNDDDAYGKRYGVSGVFTPDLRNEIFYSKSQKLYSHAFQHSDTELYKSTRPLGKGVEISQSSIAKESPNEVTQNIFNKFFQQRLHAIRVHELLLKQKEQSLTAMEMKLNEKQRHLDELQQKLDKRHISLENKLRTLKPNTRQTKTHSKKLTSKAQLVEKETEEKFTIHDDSYCSIEPQDTHSPTVAKLNIPALSKLSAAKAHSIRKVTFQSPKQIINYDIENMPPQKQQISKRNIGCNNSRVDTTQRRKSLLTLLGIKRCNKEPSKDNVSNKLLQQSNAQTHTQQILSQCEPEKLTNIWTKANKRAAFDLLAAMNSTDVSKRSSSCEMRQSLRQSRRSSLNRDRMRHSLKVMPLAVETA